MTDIPEGFVEYRPAKSGEAPPYWQAGMAWDVDLSGGTDFDEPTENLSSAVAWNKSSNYLVPREAVHGPDDVVPLPIKDALHILRQYPADELAKHGVTLEPEQWLIDAANYCTGRGGFIGHSEITEYLRTHCRPIGDA